MYGAAYATGPAACDDARVIKDLNIAYASYSSSVKSTLAIGFSPVRELALVEKVDELDTPKNRRALGGYVWGRSRYCLAKVNLQSGEEDVAYYRIDSFKAEEGKYMLTPCFTSMEKTLALTNACIPFQPK